LILEYSISQANTWEKKSVTINFSQGTSAGTWGKTNGYGVLLQWFLGANANRVGDTYLNSWANWSAYEVMSSNATQLFTNANAEFYLTGVQLEVGDKATPFEHRSFGEELALCQRYYYKHAPTSGITYLSHNYAGSQYRLTLPFFVEMRSNPSVAYSNVAGGTSITSTTGNTQAVNFYASGGWFYFDTNTDVTASAEL